MPSTINLLGVGRLDLTAWREADDIDRVVQAAVVGQEADRGHSFRIMHHLQVR